MNIIKKHQSSSESGDALKILFHYKTYKETYKFLKKSEWWNKNQIEKYQLQQLEKCIRHAYENIPYYTQLFNQLGLKPSDIQDFTDLKKIPYLTRQKIKENNKSCLAKNYKKNRVEYITTRGSTGEPMGFYIEKGIAEANHLAYFQDLMDRFHCSFKNRKVNILRNTKPYEYQLLNRSLTLSPFFMKDEKIPLYIKKIKNYNPEYIITYPSAITLLAKYIRRNHITYFPKVKSILCSGETIYEWQRNLIKETFNCSVGTYYGHSEQAIFSGNCDHSDNYHVSPQYGIIELINQQGKPVKKSGEMGEIVVTGFNNYAFPFIRYKTEDIGVLAIKKCDCGREYPLLESVEGRLQEFVVLKSQKIIPLTGIFCSIVADFAQNVRECQFLQEEAGKLILNIVKTNEYTSEDEQRLLDNFKKNLGNEIDLSIHHVDSIPLTKGGKHQFLVQKLPIDFYTS